MPDSRAWQSLWPLPRVLERWSDLRLERLEVKGYRRLLDVKVNLAGKIIAIVGPNEAGKTSLLHALARLDKGDAVPPQIFTGQ